MTVSAGLDTAAAAGATALYALWLVALKYALDIQDVIEAVALYPTYTQEQIAAKLKIRRTALCHRLRQHEHTWRNWQLRNSGASSGLSSNSSSRPCLMLPQQRVWLAQRL